MNHGITTLSIVPGRNKPADSAEMSTQLLFGEAYRILEQQDKWTRVACAHDGYECWVDNKQLHPVSETTYREASQQMFPRLRSTCCRYRDEPQYLVKGSALPSLNEGIVFPDQLEQGRQITRNPILPEELPALAREYLGAPYLWGGRTPFGLDCSGYVQMLFLFAGVFLSRDASDQVKEGDPVPCLSEARANDLAFFHNEKGNITHVGLLLEPYTIIHASGKVRIDDLTEEGIVNRGSGKVTHQLASIRRYL